MLNAIEKHGVVLGVLITIFSILSAWAIKLGFIALGWYVIGIPFTWKNGIIFLIITQGLNYIVKYTLIGMKKYCDDFSKK